MEYRTFLPIDPLPCPRPRIRVVKLKNGKSFANAYYPAEYQKWVAEFVELFKDKHIVPFDGPVRVRLCFDCRKARTSKLLIPGGDVDNYAKSVLDGLTKVGMWDDDKQVSGLLVIKRWAVPDKVVNTVGIHLRIKSLSL